MQIDRHRVQVGVEQVRVDVERDLGGLVSEHPLQRQHVHPGADRQRRTGVPQIVRA